MPFTKADLKYEVSRRGSHFFDRDTMKFFGDTLANFCLSSTTIKGREVWVLSRRRPTKLGTSKAYYFDKQTYEQVYP